MSNPVLIALFLVAALTASPAIGASEEIELIVVTATKRETALADTALSVGVLSGQDLVNAGFYDLHDYWRAVASLVVTDQGFGGDRITVRGLGEEPNGIAESMTAVYFDETPINAADGLLTMSPSLQLVDLARVEVLRGPQGTLFGANAMGGALRLIPNAPDPESFQQSYAAALATTAHGEAGYRAHAVWNMPIGTESAVRIVPYDARDGGFIEDIGSGKANNNRQRVTGLRAALTHLPTDRLSLSANVVLQERRADGFNFVDPVGKPSLGLDTSGRYQAALLQPQFRRGDTRMAVLKARYAGSWADWVSITSSIDYEANLQIDLSEEAQFIFGDYAPLFSATGYRQKTRTQEVRLSSPSGSRYQWLAGIYWMDQELPRRDQFFLFDEPVQNVTARGDRRDLGLFGEVSVPLSERLTVTAGLRWFDVKKRESALQNGITTGFVDVLTQLAYEESGVAPKLAIDWHANEQTLLYILASRGFRPGGGNTPLAVSQCGAPASFDSDQLWNYEAGVKAALFNGTIRLAASAYVIDWSEAQVELRPEGCNDVFVLNAGEAVSRGVEAELQGSPGEGWDLRFSASITDSKINRVPPESGIANGTDLPLVPAAVVALGSTHHLQLAGRPGWLHLEWQYTGPTQSSLFPSQNMELDSYHLINARLGVEFGPWTATLFADNVLDKRAKILCCRIDGGFTINRPRTIGLEISAQIN